MVYAKRTRRMAASQEIWPRKLEELRPMQLQGSMGTVMMTNFGTDEARRRRREVWVSAMKLVLRLELAT